MCNLARYAIHAARANSRQALTLAAIRFMSQRRIIT